MPTSYTTNLRLANPGLGDTGWGTTASNGMIDLVDPAIAGTTTLSTDADVTLTTANGATDQARQMILNCTGSRAAQRTITAPASSKVYVVINGTTGGFGVKLVGVGPTTGVVVPAGRMAVLAWNGSDFVTLGAVVDLTASGNVTLSALTASTALALDANKQVVSVTNTGTGNNVLSAGPTLTGTTTLAALTASGNVSFDGGAFVFNESGADKDARFEGDTDANLLFLDASTDRVGVGTSSPGNKLQVVGRIGVGPLNAITADTGIDFSDSSNTGGFSLRWLDSNGYVANISQFSGGHATTPNVMEFNNSAGYRWKTNGTERMRLDSSGNLGIGTVPSASAKVFGLSGNDQHGLYGQVQGTGNAYYGVLGVTTKTSGIPSGGTIGISRDGTTFGILGYYDTVTNWGGYFNGNVYTTGSYQPSDARLKENVQTLSGSLQIITALRPVEFDWRPGSSQGKTCKGHDVGLIAQEVLPVLPELVKEIAGASPLQDAEPSLNAQLGTFYTLDYARLVPHLIGAIQEQQDLITALTARVAALEAG